MVSRYRNHIKAAAVAASTAVALVAVRPGLASATTSARTSTGAQVITVERPTGQIGIGDVSVGAGGRLALTVTDTRAGDPGWTVSVTASAAAQLGWKPYLVHETAPFTASDGTSYAQEVTPGPAIVAGHSAAVIDNAVLGSAERGHGLGIAVLGAKLTAGGHQANDAPAATVTVTVV